jgi:hypothetical protein
VQQQLGAPFWSLGLFGPMPFGRHETWEDVPEGTSKGGPAELRISNGDSNKVLDARAGQATAQYEVMDASSHNISPAPADSEADACHRSHAMDDAMRWSRLPARISVCCLRDETRVKGQIYETHPAQDHAPSLV